MRKFIFTMITMLVSTVSSQAMSYEQARQQALFLADKMAYELNLTDEQYEACYEVNLDYFMGVNSQADLFGDYWTRRNLDISYILAEWQYQMFLDAAYFYRPLYWDAGFWHFRIYARYPHRDYFYFGRPHFYDVYRGGHAWRMNGGRSWYHGRDFGHRVARNNFSGMRDGFNNGRYGRGGDINRGNGSNRGGSNMRHGGQSSTRSTVGSRNKMVEQSRGKATMQNRTAGSRSNQVFGGNGSSVQNRSQSSVSRSGGFSSGAQRTNTGVQQRSVTTNSSRTSMNGGSHTRSSSVSSAGRSMSGGSSHSSSSHSGGSRSGNFGGARR